MKELKIATCLRGLRLERKETLRQMAKNLNVTPAFLSAVENGKKKFSGNLCTALSSYYKLSLNQLKEIQDAALESADTIKLDISKSSISNKNLAISFARSFNDLDEERSAEILKILSE